MIAALYVDPKGVYSGRPDVECWGLPDRDAREYAGPWPVVAHSPCERWGRYWGGSPTTWPRKVKGDDGGCFARALECVREYTGVLEHPEASAAWLHFGLRAPDRGAGWLPAGDFIGWTCCVEQGHYGHRARKATWLYAVGLELPSLLWCPSEASIRLDDGYHSAEERSRAVKTGAGKRLGKRERSATPPAFAELLLSMARTAQRQAA